MILIYYYTCHGGGSAPESTPPLVAPLKRVHVSIDSMYKFIRSKYLNRNQLKNMNERGRGDYDVHYEVNKLKKKILYNMALYAIVFRPKKRNRSNGTILVLIRC